MKSIFVAGFLQEKNQPTVEKSGALKQVTLL
jgi:hypothetical protein